MNKKIRANFIVIMLFIVVNLAIWGESTLDEQKKHDKKFEHKYVAGDCIGFDLYDWDFERNSEGESLGEARIEYVRYDKYGAYYGLRLIEDRYGDKPKFKYPKVKKPLGLMWASEIDNARIVHAFSYTDYIPGSKVITIRNGMTCRHGWKDEK